MIGVAMSRTETAGLCGSCVHARVVTSSRGSIFRLCQRSLADPRFPRYPVLPVLACAGYEPEPEAPPPIRLR
jgi:hypothetical protein